MAAILAATISNGTALAHSDETVFRTVSFICANGGNSTAYVEVENLLGQRKSVKVTYLNGEATLFVIARSTRGSVYHTVKQIDLRSETQKADIRRAAGLAEKMLIEDGKYCTGEARNLRAARAELSANHDFNRSHAGYRGK
jgi:hypothetical protein